VDFTGAGWSCRQAFLCNGVIVTEGPKHYKRNFVLDDYRSSARRLTVQRDLIFCRSFIR
jgi:hypothetical protein